MNKYLVIGVIAILALAAICQAQDDLEARKSFFNFVKKYNKKFSNPEEVTLRFENFKASIARSNEKNKNSKGAVYGITKFSDLSPSEFKETILMKNPILVDNSVPRDPSRVRTPQNVELPASIDWIAKGAVTPVKDQEQCGSCWAFSATENIESMWIIAGRGTNETVDLSPQQIVDCDNSDDGCNGGNPPTAYDYVISAGGMDDIEDYPYTAEDGNCAFNKAEVKASISNWNYANSLYSESELQASLVAYGPLSVCVDASNWQDYQSGVMTWTECAYLNVLDHCVQLTGYNTAAAVPYYTVRNSWNTNWGIEGYIWLEMGEDTCGIAHEATYSVV